MVLIFTWLEIITKNKHKMLLVFTWLEIILIIIHSSLAHALEFEMISLSIQMGDEHGNLHATFLCIILIKLSFPKEEKIRNLKILNFTRG